jgi:hypothetical protein
MEYSQPINSFCLFLFLVFSWYTNQNLQINNMSFSHNMLGYGLIGFEKMHVVSTVLLGPSWAILSR